MVTLNTTLIPKLKGDGIRFRYIGGVYDPMTIIVTYKNLNICRVDMNCNLDEPYNYNIYWFPSTVKNANRLRKHYAMSQDFIDDIRIVINTNFKGENNMRVKVESVDVDLNTASMINGPMTSDYTIKVNVGGFDPNFSIRVKEAIESIDYSNESLNNKDIYYYGGRGNCKTRIDWRKVLEKEYAKFDIKDVIFNNPATIVFWTDGTKTVVKAENEPFDPEKGLAMAISKRALGNNYNYYDVFKKYVGRYEKKQKKG